MEQLQFCSLQIIQKPEPNGAKSNWYRLHKGWKLIVNFFHLIPERVNNTSLYNYERVKIE